MNFQKYDLEKKKTVQSRTPPPPEEQYIEEAKVELEAIENIKINIPEEESKEESGNHIVEEHKMVEDDACFCSRYARNEGVNIPAANAIDLVASTTPELGGGILFSYGTGIDKHHIGVIRVFLKEGFFIEEANHEPCKVTTRIVKYNDPYIIGFIDKKRDD